MVSTSRLHAAFRGYGVVRATYSDSFGASRNRPIPLTSKHRHDRPPVFLSSLLTDIFGRLRQLLVRFLHVPVLAIKEADPWAANYTPPSLSTLRGDGHHALTSPSSRVPVQGNPSFPERLAWISRSPEGGAGGVVARDSITWHAGAVL